MERVRFLFSLRFQILMAISIMVLTAVILLGLLVTYFARSSVLEEKRRIMAASAQTIQRALGLQSSAESAAGVDGLRQSAARIGEQYFDSRAYHSISVYDNSHEVLWSTLPRERWSYAHVFSRDQLSPLQSLQVNVEQDPESGQAVLVALFPWKIGGAPVGMVQVVQFVSAPGGDFLFSGQLILVFAVCYAGVVILFGYLLLTRTVVKPIQEITRGVKRLSAGERGVTLPEGETNELGQLALSFNRMAAQLMENERYMSEQIEELLQVNEELELTRNSLIRSEKLASIGRLAAGVAHEVGNPLSAILGYTELLKAGGLDEETTRDFLRRIEQDTTRIHTIIKGLLDYSRAQPERIEPLDLNRVVTETLDLLKPQKQFKRIEFEFRSHVKPAPVRGDMRQLQQVLVNLFLNASHAMNEQGGVTVFLERVLFDPSLTYRQTSRRFHAGQSLISLSVIDQGHGIEPETLDRIFDPFFTTKEPGSGTGLGLSVCDKIIDTFGGAIEASSQPGQGATFTILLPEDITPEKPEPGGQSFKPTPGTPNDTPVS